MSKGKRRKAAERNRRMGVGLMGLLDSGDLPVSPHLQYLFEELDATSIAISNLYTRNVDRNGTLSYPSEINTIWGSSLDRVFTDEMIDFLPAPEPAPVTRQTIREVFVNNIAEHARRTAHDTLIYGNSHYMVMPGIPQVIHEPYTLNAVMLDALWQSMVIQPGRPVGILTLDEKPPLHSPVLGGTQVDNRTGLEPTLRNTDATV